jgi:hypothetical protein
VLLCAALDLRHARKHATCGQYGFLVGAFPAYLALWLAVSVLDPLSWLPLNAAMQRECAHVA